MDILTNLQEYGVIGAASTIVLIILKYNGKQGWKAVSYTHLDVYKRQVSKASLVCWKRISPSAVRVTPRELRLNRVVFRLSSSF